MQVARRFSVAANQELRSSGSSVHFGHEWLDPYRARRISTLLSESCPKDREYCRKIQADVVSLAGLSWVNAVLALRTCGCFLLTSQQEAVALDLLADWDGSMVPDSRGAAIYLVWRRALLERLYDSEAGRLSAGYLGRGPHTVVASANNFAFRHSHHLIQRLERAVAAANSHRNGAILAETDNELRLALKESLASAIMELQMRAGENPQGWRLACFHRVTFSHPFGTKPVIGRLFSRGPFPVSGDNDTVCASLPSQDSPYDRVAAIPSYRLLVDMSPGGKTTSLIAGGQSGHPLSSNYANQLGEWRSVDRGHPLLLERDLIRGNQSAILTLSPLSPS